MKYLFVILSLVVLICTRCSSGKSATSNINVQQLLNSRNYTFVAQYAQPLGGRQIPLTTEYTLTVKGDSLVSYLPYFGQAYVAPINTSDVGLEFTSTQFDYYITANRKGSYDINIKPKEQAKASQLTLSVTSGGYANLQVLSNNRQAINFRGVMRAAK